MSHLTSQEMIDRAEELALAAETRRIRLLAAGLRPTQEHEATLAVAWTQLAQTVLLQEVRDRLPEELEGGRLKVKVSGT